MKVTALSCVNSSLLFLCSFSSFLETLLTICNSSPLNNLCFSDKDAQGVQFFTWEVQMPSWAVTGLLLSLQICMGSCGALRQSSTWALLCWAGRALAGGLHLVGAGKGPLRPGDLVHFFFFFSPCDHCILATCKFSEENYVSVCVATKGIPPGI